VIITISLRMTDRSVPEDIRLQYQGSCHAREGY
jgi:hypothetical protein